MSIAAAMPPNRGQPSEPVPMGPETRSPPVQAANQIALAMSSSDIALTLGQVRQVINPETGFPGEQAALEWLLTVVLSAPTARNLRDALGVTIQEYEKRFGSIPRDPAQEAGAQGTAGPA